MHVTRIDIAIDDRNPKPYFTIEQLYKKCEKDEFISGSTNFELIKSNARNITNYLNTSGVGNEAKYNSATNMHMTSHKKWLLIPTDLERLYTYG